MKVGIKLPNSGPFANVEALRRVALESERLGFDSLWVHDHASWRTADAEWHFVAGAWEAWPRPVVPNVYESVTTLAWLAALTTDVELGSSVVVLPLRNPVWFAKMTATIDQLSGGRLIVGVGAGGSAYAKRELEAIGRPELGEKRGEVVDEWIDVVRGIWTDPVYSAELNRITIKEAEVFPKPARPGGPPIWYGGSTAIGKRRSVQRCDGWLPMYLTPQELTEGKDELAKLASDAGIDKTVTIGSEHWVAIADTDEEARERSHRTRWGHTEYINNLPGVGKDTSFLQGREDDGNIFGSPDTVAARLAEYQAAGVDHLIARIIAHDMDEFVVMLGRFKEALDAVRA